jgi:hypothetical protein
MLISSPREIINGINRRDTGGIPHWPPYYAQGLNLGLKKWTTDKQLVVTDQPWAVAWYADRTSIWLPPTKKGFEYLESIAADSQTPVAGILISPVSSQKGSIAEISGLYRDFTSLVIDGRVAFATYPAPINIFDKDPKIEAIMKRYPNRANLLNVDMLYYSDRALRASDTQ